MSVCWREIGTYGDRTCGELATHLHCRNCPTFARAAATLFTQPAPAGYAEERTPVIAAAKPGATPARACLVFRLGAEWLALDAVACVSILAVPVVRRIPHRARAVLRGVINVAGEILLCVALDRILGGGDAAGAVGARARAIVIHHRGDRWGFVADEVGGLERIPLAALTAAPVTISRGLEPFIEAVVDLDGRHVGVLGTDRLFDGLRRRVG
ncbi:MAG: chemotaxis protein CheW [Deltaproteobacteria bacterium]|nr:chemotaxis protein CheW [Deltaproteobacteria bacterium]